MGGGGGEKNKTKTSFFGLQRLIIIPDSLWDLSSLRENNYVYYILVLLQKRDLK